MAISQNIIRASWILEGVGHGARETWFFPADQPDLNAAFPRWASVVPYRAALLPTEAMLKAYEMSIEYLSTGAPLLNDSLISYQFLNGLAGTSSADYELSLLIKGQNATRTKRRNAYLRFIWDTIEISGGRYTSPQQGPWQTQLNKYKDQLIALGVGYIRWQRNPPVALSSYTPTPAVGLDPPPGTVNLTFAADIFTGQFASGKQKLRVYTARKPSQLSGVQIVVPTGARSCTTVNQIAVLQQSVTGWTGSTYEPFFERCVFLDDQKVVERKMGRPLLEPPGRRKARARI